MIVLLTRKETDVGNVPGLQPLVLAEVDSFRPEMVAGAEALLVEAADVRFALRVFNRLRAAPQAALYLMPAYLFSDLPVNDRYLVAIADGLVGTAGLATVAHQAEKIVNETRRFPDLSEGESGDTAIALKTLRFMASRGVDLAPVIMPKSRFGYVYPMVGAHFADRDDVRVFAVVDLIDREKLADARFIDRVHLCPHCQSAFLNLRETCPRCNGGDLEVDDLVHHFPCGNVEAQARYRVRDQLICPKCERMLRHIGMDYDKPGLIYTCRSCHHSFQDADVWGFCFYCERAAPLQNLLRRDLKSYRASQATLRAAENGLRFSLADLVRDKMRLADYAVFQDMARYELERDRRYRRGGAVVHFQLENSRDLNQLFGQKKEQFALEMARIIRETLRDSDVISPLNESTFAFLLVETTMENARLCIARLQNRMDELLRENVPEAEVHTGSVLFTLEEYNAGAGKTETPAT